MNSKKDAIKEEDESSEDIYSADGIEAFFDADAISSAEEGFMMGYLGYEEENCL